MSKLDNMTIGEVKEIQCLLGGGGPAVKGKSDCHCHDSPKICGDFRIVVLQRGWVFIGKLYQDGTQCRVEDAQCIATWGTIKGLGQLALNGPTKDTKLEPSGVIRFHESSIVTTLDTEQSKWK